MNRAVPAGLAAGLAAILAAALPAAAAAQEGDGAALFAQACAVCHGEAGVGNPGLAPPLNLAPFCAGLGAKAPGYLAGVVAAGLTGRISAGGVDYVGLAMPPQSHLSDAEAAEVATYVLGALGGTGQSVTEAEIAAARAAPPAHGDLRKMRKGT